MSDARSSVLIVDDSGFMRIALRKMLAAEASVEVIGEARNGAEAIELTRELDPDIVTMDIEMPVLDGLDAVRTIMAEMPRPILMVSHLTQAGSAATIKALQLGAVDFISKVSSVTTLDAAQIERDLLEKVRYWGRQPRRREPPRLPAAPAAKPQPRAEPRPLDLVLIGASTGGPRVMFELLKGMQGLRCPVVIAQHMPAAFTRSFAQHLRDDTGHPVVEGAAGMDLAPGSVTILPGGGDWVVRRRSPDAFCLARRDNPDLPVHPSVDILFESAAAVAQSAVGVILTGMGSDGTAGGRALHRRGFPLLVQSPESCAVDGMPGAAIAAGIAAEALSVPAIAKRLNQWGAA